MKHIWQTSSIKVTGHAFYQWVHDKRVAFEQKTQVGWTDFNAGGKVILRPYISVNTPTMQHYDYEIQISEYLKINGESDFVDIADNTGISLKNVLMLVKKMTVEQKLIADVDRSGKWTLARYNNKIYKSH